MTFLQLNAPRGLTVALASLAICAGCQRSSLPRTPVQEVPVTGIVTLDGQPLAGAAVAFIDPSTMSAFTAATKEDGSYHLSTSYGGETVCKGLFRVTISKLALPAGVQPQPNTSPLLLGGKESLLAKYSNSSASQLTVDVPEQGGEFDFALTGR